MDLEPIRRILDALGVRYALIGGHALAARGYPRFTVDIDLFTTDQRAGAPRLGAAVRPGRRSMPGAVTTMIRSPAWFTCCCRTEPTSI